MSQLFIDFLKGFIFSSLSVILYFHAWPWVRWWFFQRQVCKGCGRKRNAHLNRNLDASGIGIACPDKFDLSVGARTYDKDGYKCPGASGCIPCSDPDCFTCGHSPDPRRDYRLPHLDCSACKVLGRRP